VILVDTHVVVWLAFDQDQISKKARTAIDDARENADGLAISDITLLELTTLASKGRICLDISLESFLQEVESRFVVLPNQWPCVRPRHGASSELSQGSRGSHYRGYCIGRGAGIQRTCGSVRVSWSGSIRWPWNDMPCGAFTRPRPPTLRVDHWPAKVKSTLAVSPARNVTSRSCVPNVAVHMDSV
jgi:predicted nucleic acid-binding protein